MDSNGFEYVDLGLPSGTLWATCNVGADDPYHRGLYFQWGSTVGYRENDVLNLVKRFNSDYRDYDFALRSYCGFNKYNKYNNDDLLEVLELEEDAAHAYMGGDWRMPIKEDFDELLFNTIPVGFDNKVNGIMFKSLRNNKELFMIGTDFVGDGFFKNHNRDILLWSASSSSRLTRYDCGCSFHANIFTRSTCYNYRFLGFNVRGVLK